MPVPRLEGQMMTSNNPKEYAPLAGMTTSKSHNSIQPRVLLFSQRNIFNHFLFRCPHYEFEDVVCQMDSVDVLAPRAGKWFDSRYGLAKRLAWYSSVALNPGVPSVKVNKTYDLFFAVCGSPVDLLTINTIGNWKDFAKTSVCLVDELWVRELPAYKHLLKILAKFDFVMLYYSQGVKAIGEAVASKCSFLPPGIDSILFCPYPAFPDRGVDVYSIGRRSEVTHQQLLKMARDNGIFYLHDSISSDRAINATEHRALLANTAKRSRYFIVNPALIDRPSVRGTQNEMGNRYFEGAASGAIMIGEQPDNEDFEKLFDWPRAVLPLPYNSGDIAKVIEDSDSQPAEQARMRQNNVVNTLLRHDWAYRWEAILTAAGLTPMPGLLERKRRLKHLAKEISALPASDFNMPKEACDVRTVAE